jgi:hypothetical protein
MRVVQAVRKLRNVFWFCLALGLISGCSAKDDNGDARQTIDIASAPDFRGTEYRCKDMVRVVNYLRSLGKKDAIAALREHLKRHDMDERVHLICRCLFVNSGRWRPPAVGELHPLCPEEGVRRFPVFPLAFSGRVPFLLVSGYLRDGLPEDPQESLEVCETLPLIASDLPTIGYEAAARSLVTSAEFKALFPEPDIRRQMADMVMNQTKDESGEKDKGVGSLYTVKTPDPFITS